MLRKIFGAYGEDLAAKFLKRKGYKIIHTNYRCRQGEIDLVAMEGRTLVFVEVKTRSSEEFGRGMEAVNPRKQQKIRNTAVNYLKEKPLSFSQIRFDVIDIIIKANQPASIEHIENAF